MDMHNHPRHNPRAGGDMVIQRELCYHPCAWLLDQCVVQHFAPRHSSSLRHSRAATGGGRMGDERLGALLTRASLEGLRHGGTAKETSSARYCTGYA